MRTLIALLVALALAVPSSVAEAKKKRKPAKKKRPAAAKTAPAPAPAPTPTVDDPMPAPTGRVAVFVEGPRSAAKSVLAALPASITLVADARFEAALDEERGSRLLGKSLASSRSEAIGWLQNAGRAAGADAVVVIVVERQKSETVAMVTIVNVANGEVLLEGRDAGAAELARALDKVTTGPAQPVAVKKAEKKAEKKVAAVAVAPPAAIEESEEQAPAEPTVTGPLEPTGIRRMAATPEPNIEARAALELGGRRLAYNDQLSQNLNPYALFGAPLAAVHLAVFPFAGKGGPLRPFGASASYERAFLLSSETTDGGSVATDWSRLDISAHARVQLDRPVGPVLTASAGYGQLDFSFEEDPMMMGTGFPSSAYRWVRLGGDARFPSGRYALALDAAYLVVLSAGELDERFPNQQGAGLELGAAATMALTGSLEARLSGGYTRFFHDLRPDVGDLYVAGGAIDEYLVLQLGLSYAK